MDSSGFVALLRQIEPAGARWQATFGSKVNADSRCGFRGFG
jgi:hypothetical protein